MGNAKVNNALLAKLGDSGGNLTYNGTPVGTPVTFASQEEAEDGLDETKSMNPLRTAQAIAALAGSGGGLAYYAELVVAVSDETTDLTAGTAKATFRMPFLMELTEVRASVNTAPTGSGIQVGINKGGSTILGMENLSIDADAKTSVGSVTPPTVVVSTLEDDAEITIDILYVGSSTPVKGLKVTLKGMRPSNADILLAVSDEVTNLTTGTAKITFRMPYAMTLTSVRASVTEAPTGSALVIDVNESGASVFSTNLQIDDGSETSVGSMPAVISDAALADDAEITIDIDQVGSTTPGKGLKVRLKGTRV